VILTWHPIKDFETDPSRLASAELTVLGNLWTEQRAELEQRGLLAPFLERLRREWAIETGILERLYDLDRGVTRMLIEKGISEDVIGHNGSDRDPTVVAQIIRDHTVVAEGLLDFIGGGRNLSLSYIKELHAALTRSRPTTEAVDQFGRIFETKLIHGDYKQLPNNPTRIDGSTHEYAPPVHVAAEMDRLISMHDQHDADSVAPEVEAAFLHHRFTQIHPFQDGNGRVARALTSLVFLKSGWFPPVVRRDDRSDYLDSLELADEGDLSELVGLLVRVQKRSLLQALSLSDAVQRASRTSDVVAIIGEKFAARKVQHRSEELALAGLLREQATTKLQQVQRELTVAIADGTFKFFVDDDKNDEERAQWNRNQIIQTARELDYFADVTAFHRWARLGIRDNDSTEILISLHGVGRFNPRAVAASAMIFFREYDGVVRGPWALCDELFLAEPSEPRGEVMERFNSWLERALIVGLEQWRQQVGLT
jgi:Fic family protein